MHRHFEHHHLSTDAQIRALQEEIKKLERWCGECSVLLQCPYCRFEQDGRNFAPLHEPPIVDAYVDYKIQCAGCGKYYGIHMGVVNPSTVDLDCANGEPHKWRPKWTPPDRGTRAIGTEMQCQFCELLRPMTDAEKKEYNDD